MNLIVFIPNEDILVLNSLAVTYQKIYPTGYLEFSGE